MKTLFKTLFSVLATVAVVSTAAVLPARAVVEVNINKGNVDPLPIALTDFLSGDQLGAEITSIIAADLERSGLFAPIDKKHSSRKSAIRMSHRVLKTGKSSMHRHWLLVVSPNSRMVV